MKKRDILGMKSTAYYSGLNGLEIKRIENGFVLCVSNCWHSGPKTPHRVKIQYGRTGGAFIRIHGYRIPLADCIRMNKQ